MRILCTSLLLKGCQESSQLQIRIAASAFLANRSERQTFQHGASFIRGTVVGNRRASTVTLLSAEYGRLCVTRKLSSNFAANAISSTSREAREHQRRAAPAAVRLSDVRKAKRAEESAEKSGENDALSTRSDRSSKSLVLL